jgi:uncharacterized membrane protein
MKLVIRVFLTGLAAVLPVTVTLYVLYWLGSTAEAFLGGGLKMLIRTACTGRGWASWPGWSWYS